MSFHVGIYQAYGWPRDDSCISAQPPTTILRSRWPRFFTRHAVMAVSLVHHDKQSGFHLYLARIWGIDRTGLLLHFAYRFWSVSNKYATLQVIHGLPGCKPTSSFLASDLNLLREGEAFYGSPWLAYLHISTTSSFLNPQTQNTHTRARARTSIDSLHRGYILGSFASSDCCLLAECRSHSFWTWAGCWKEES